jgi:hypothetical protein
MSNPGSLIRSIAGGWASAVPQPNLASTIGTTCPGVSRQTWWIPFARCRDKGLMSQLLRENLEIDVSA